MNDPVITAVIAAGAWKGQPPNGMSPWRALAPLNGRPMLAYVLDAVAASSAGDGAFLVGPPELSAVFPGIPRLDPLSRLTDNVLTAAHYALGKGRLLMVGSDIPLLTAAAIDGFLLACAPSKVQVHYSIVPKEVVQPAYPEMSRTYVRLADGTFTGGNLLLADPAFLLERAAVIEKIYLARKSPIRIARILGPEILVRLLITALFRLPLLDVKTAARLVGRALGGPVAGIPVPYPEIGADLDSEDEIAAFEKRLRRETDE